ncbi:MAG: hypothetical protein V2I43_11325 [Parvularcula sp.]|jgi:hypothetical protein|nr:hypothetical protein [Parvularcula sp.]
MPGPEPFPAQTAKPPRPYRVPVREPVHRCLTETEADEAGLEALMDWLARRPADPA